MKKIYWYCYAPVAQSVSVGPRVGATFATQSLAGDDADAYNDLIKSATAYRRALS